MTDSATQPTQTSYVDSYAPPANGAPIPVAPMEPTAPSATPTQPTDKVSQALEDQNIFYLLGVQDATDEEKDSFLDELQQVIWEDFLENDVELLLTEEEMVEFKKVGEKQDITEEERQVQMIDFLEKLVPDLEKIMLEKALELKEEMMRERMKELAQLYPNRQDVLDKVKKAEELVMNEQWRAAADELNAIVL